MGKRNKLKRAAERQAKSGPVLLGQRGTATAPDLGEAEKLVRELGGMNTRCVGVRAATLNTEQRSVETVLSTENPVRMFSYIDWEEIDEILLTDGCRHKERVPLLDSHNRYSIEKMLGYVTNIRKEGDQMVGVNNFGRDIPEVDTAWKRVEQKIVTDTSVGYRYEAKDRVMVPVGSSAFINGREYTAGDVPLVIVKRWELIENSLVPIGADEHAKIRGYGAGASKRKVKIMEFTEEQLAYMRSLGWNGEGDASEYYDGMSEAQRSYCDGLKTRAASEPPASAPSAANPSPAPAQEGGRAEGGTGTTAAEAVAQERARVAEIESICDATTPDSLRQRALSGELSADALRSLELERLRANAAPPVPGVSHGETRIEGVEHLADQGLRALQASICSRYGSPIEDPKLQREASEFKGIGLRGIAEMCIRSLGERVPYSTNEMALRALSTSAFSDLLSNSATKSILSAYRLAPITARQWCGERETSDFKTYTEIALSEFSDLAEIGNGSPIPHATIKDSGENYSVKTYGRTFGVNREMILNDDLGAFMRLPLIMARAAARNIEKIVYTGVLAQNSGLGPNMSDGKKLFAADRTTGSNYNAGAAGAFGTTGLKTLRQLLSKRLAEKSKKGDTKSYLNLQPKCLLINTTDAHDAQVLIGSENIQITGSTNTERGTRNAHYNLATVIPVPQIDDISATGWYLTADDMDAPSVALVSLNGNKEPWIKEVDDPTGMSVQWQIVHDIAAVAVGDKGIAYANGTD